MEDPINQFESPAKEFFCLGVGNFLDGKYLQAKVEFQEALKVDPGLSLAYCYLGIISLEMEEVEQGIEWCEEGLKRDLDNSYLHYCYGIALERNGDYERAIDEYLIYLEDHPSDAECLFSLGCAYDQKGMVELAIDCYKKALEFDASHYKASYNMGLVMAEQKEIDEALFYFERTVDINPTYWKGWVKLGWFYSLEKKWQEAVIAYEKAVEIKPEVADTYYNLGLSYLSLGGAKEAVFNFKQALNLHPDDADSAFYLAISLLDLQEEEEASLYLQKTLLIDLEHEKAHYLLGRLFYLQGEMTKGDKELAFLTSKGSDLVDSLKSYSEKGSDFIG